MSVSSISSSSTTTTATSAATASAAFRANRTFQSALVALNENIDKFEHQVTWQLDNSTAVTLPPGVAASSSSSTAAASSTDTTDTTATDSSTADATTAATSATTTDPSPATTIAAGFAGLESNAETSLTDLTPDQQTQLDAENAKLATEEQRFQGFAAHRGSVDAHQDNQYKGNATLLGDQVNAFEHQVTWEIDNGTAITAPNTLKSTAASATASTTATANTSSGTTTTSSDTTATDTTTGTTASTTDASTLADSISAGFAALEANASKTLGHLSAQYATQFQQLQQNLATEQARFISFATRREAYRAANPKAQTTSDVSA